MLSDLGVDATVDPFGEVWHIREGSRIAEGLHETSRFPLKPYLRLVEDFLRRDVPRIASKIVSSTKDETFYHIYFKCEQCEYLSHCRQSIERLDASADDVSAIPGVSHEGKLALRARQMRTVGDVARVAGLSGDGPTSWSLQRRSRQIDQERTEYTLVYRDPSTHLSVRAFALVVAPSSSEAWLRIVSFEVFPEFTRLSHPNFLGGGLIC